ncbi:histidinol-phosphatase (PHP family) [Hypnocyclicus thermotrophus]|uniref:Histidinol-phosphatase n=1 Tax=Hypnocyclicus thermotrophus TaxID=1627895 RepID=A0AA46DZ33_9FUSO|nr:histidinol-phosphatase HisJ family protein [Hypnocyclicus thermotrophus]TDT71469.1 histidinol-phosphatase (PHP family) [Hypnocyclicus thermotrophus]
MYIADHHVHTNWSHDGKFTMQEILEAAINKKINKIVFTDHFELLKDIEKINYNQYVIEYNKLKSKYSDKIEMGLGIEMGLLIDKLDKFDKIVKTHKFDYVLASTHRVNYISALWEEYWDEITQLEGYERYFLYMLESIKNFDNFDCYGHLDYIIRYGDFDKKGFKYKDLQDVLDEILKLLISKGKGIEINTSFRNKGFKEFHPNSEIIKRYIEFGGEIITFGTDSHSPTTLGNYAKDVYELLNNFGVNYICNFKNRKPEFIKTK